MDLPRIGRRTRTVEPTAAPVVTTAADITLRLSNSADAIELAQIISNKMSPFFNTCMAEAVDLLQKEGRSEDEISTYISEQKNRDLVERGCICKNRAKIKEIISRLEAIQGRRPGWAGKQLVLKEESGNVIELKLEELLISISDPLKSCSK